MKALRFLAILSATALLLFPFVSLPVFAGDVFSWRQAAGQTVKVMLNRHPYADGLRRKLTEFETLTGIKVAYVMYSEDKYFQRLAEAFGNGAGQPDVYMIGACQIWEYAPAGRMAPLDPWIGNPAKTRFGYNADDFFPRISGAFRWNGKAGSRPGDGQLWAVPLGFEMCALIYNREVLARYRLSPPHTLGELLLAGKRLRDFGGENTYGLAVRGKDDWNTLHAAYITAFVNAGARDLEVRDGRLVSRVNSPEAVAVTEAWIELLREAGTEDWASYDWYRCMADIGSRKAAMLMDSDILGYFANSPGSSSQSGKLGLSMPPVEGRGEKVKANLWVWGLAVNPASRNLDAAWLFTQYFTSPEFQLQSVLEWKSVNPPRRSIFRDPEFQKAVAGMHGYLDTFAVLIDNCEVCFTPTPYFFSISKRWAEVIIEIANGAHPSVQAGMDNLKAWMDAKLADVKVE